MTGIGHNTTIQGAAAEALKSFVERIERLAEEKAALAADIREVYSELKSYGLDPKIVRQIVRLRKMDRAEREEQEALLDVYKQALGMLADTPLGEAALTAAAPDEADAGKGGPKSNA